MDGHQQLVDTHVGRDAFNIDNMPHEVAEQVVEIVRSWTGRIKDEKKRSEATKLRDSTLKAVALTSRLGYKLYHSFLLQNVIIEPARIPLLHQILSRRNGDDDLIKSLVILSPPREMDEKMENVLATVKIRTNPELTSEEQDEQVFLLDEQWRLKLKEIQDMADWVLSKSTRLETLVIECPDRITFSFVDRIGQGLVPSTFLTNSLRRLQIRHPKASGMPHFSGTAAIWLLCFCPLLSQVILDVSITVYDSVFFANHVEAFKGKSRVKDLAIEVQFEENSKIFKSKWETPSELRRKWACGSRKSQSVFQMLQVTRRLRSCEIGLDGAKTNSILGLWSSRETIRHFRVFGAAPESRERIPLDYSIFTGVKILSLDLASLEFFLDDESCRFPLSLEVLGLDRYYQDLEDEKSHVYHEEDIILKKVLSTRLLPNLKLVAVPSRPVAFHYDDITNSTYIKSWEAARRSLEQWSLFKNGNVSLCLVTPGEVLGNKGENCLSTQPNISPFLD